MWTFIFQGVLEDLADVKYVPPFVRPLKLIQISEEKSLTAVMMTFHTSPNCQSQERKD
jgi:hypothetical protein